MAQYPTFEEYQKHGNYGDGIKRCDHLLARNPNDVQLLTVKLRLLAAVGQDLGPTLDRLHALRPPVQDTRGILAIEEAVVEALRDVYPPPRTAGPAMAKFYDEAMKAVRNSPDQRTNLQTLRFTTAVYDDRLEDAQQALIQLKALQPRNRVLYMAHLAVTQLLSTTKDDLQSRLALSLARKAVSEQFGADAKLDCRVPGQVLALQGQLEDLQKLPAAMRESKQVYDALKSKDRRNSQDGDEAEELKTGAKDEPTTESTATEVEALKKQFKTIIRSGPSLSALTKFTVVATQAFHSATRSSVKGKARRLIADACFLCISPLVKAFELSTESRYLLLAAYLAETLLVHEPHIHEARLILVYLYMRLGLGSSAARLFDSLKVKEIQHDTIAHVLLTDISYTHPYSIDLGKREPFDPLKRATQAIAMYGRSEEKLAESEAGIFNHGQTGMIFDIHELRDKLRTSLTRRLVFLEQRRLTRLVNGREGEDTSKLGARVLANWLEYSDNRDFEATFDFGYNVERALHLNDRLPARSWLLFGLGTDASWALARRLSPPVSDVDELIEGLSDVSAQMERVEVSDGEQTRATTDSSYRVAADLACQVLRLQHELSRGQTTVERNVDAVSAALEKLNVDGLIEHADRLCDTIKAHYAYIDVLRVVVSASQSVAERTRGSSSTAALDSIQKRARSMFGELQKHGMRQAKRLESKDVQSMLESEGDVWQALQPLGQDHARKFCDSVVDAARVGWDGLTKIKLI